VLEKVQRIMNRKKWFDRKFDANNFENSFPSIIERLRGTPIRMEEKTSRLSKALLEIKPEAKWSIKEHIGHLIDLEQLWQGRLQDILEGAEFLRPTDLDNKKTDFANHNLTDLNTLFLNFRAIREQTIALLEPLNETDILTRFALHPRLHTPMRTLDLFLFVAEHDDHHLVSIQEIIQMELF
jgi:uncharacterized damage-inducible protein DinB